MKSLKTWLGLMLLATLASCGKAPVSENLTVATDSAAPSAFVQVKGKQFQLAGKPYYFVGTNFWYGAYLGAAGDKGDRARLIKELDQLKAAGVTNLRVLAASEASALVMSLKPAIQTAPGQIDEELWQGLDFLLSEMAKREMKAVLFLNNFWQWSGGMSQYVAWQTGEPVLDPDLTKDWNAFMQNSARFYRLAESQALYRSLIKQLIERTNTVTGVAYKADPTIMSWQLANEPRPGSGEAGAENAEVYVQWVNDTAQFIKQLAPQQLVSTGSEGSRGALDNMDLFIKAHQSPYVDYLTFHLWPKNWLWFDIKQAEQTYASGLAASKAYIEQHIAVADQMNKPLVMEEFGIERDGADYRPEATTVWRDKFYTEFFQLIEQEAKAGRAIAGSNFWTWGGAGRTERADFIWQAGDDYLGDPPQEPQGLNSVFDQDQSTISLLKAHATVMNGL